MFRLLAGIALIFAIYPISMTAHATSAQIEDCLPFSWDIERDVRVTYAHVDYRGTQKRCYDFTGLSIGNEIDDVLGRLLGKRNILLQDLRVDFDSLARSQITDFTVKSTSLDLPGPMSFRLTGVPNGSGDIGVAGGGLAVLASIKVEKSWYLDGRVSISTNPISISGRYNVFTGLIDRVQIVNLNPRVDIDIHTALDYLVPGLSHLVTNLVENELEDKFELEIESAVNALVSSSSTTIFGLDSEIPIGEFIINGQDLGVIVRTELARVVGEISIQVIQTGKEMKDTTLRVIIPSEDITLTLASMYVQSYTTLCYPNDCPREIF